MPSVNEVWEQALQINANLAIVHNDMVQLLECCEQDGLKLDALIGRADESNDWLEELRQLVDDGFVAVSEGLKQVQQRQDLANRLALFQIRQQDTMICALEKISKNTCDLVVQSKLQTELQTEIRTTNVALESMFATAHPAAALEHARALDTQKRLAQCCSETRKPPPCLYEPCERPSDRPSTQMPESGAKLTNSLSKVIRRKSTDE